MRGASGVASARLGALAALLVCLALPGSAAGQGMSCASFHSQRDAQAVLDANLRNGLGDRFGLDPDGDGVACEDAEARDSGPPTGADAADAEPSPAAARGTYHFPDPRDADVDRYWQRTFADAGARYRSPNGLLPVGPAAFRGLCDGLLEPVDTVAFYCPADSKIYFDREARAWIADNYGDVAWTVVMAHEWGHHVQFLLDPLAGYGVSSASVEQQADCLAGAYLADALARDWIDEADLDAAWQLMLDSGDSVTHGTASDRLDAFGLGVAEGPTACEIDL